MTRRLRRAVRTAGTLLALALVLAACSSGEPKRTGPVRGGTLRVAVRDLSSLDPAKASGRGATLVLAQLFRPLTRLDAEGLPQPAAAMSWTTSADGLRWEFTLDDGTFHDGSPVTAADFKLAFDRIAQKDMDSDAAFQFESVRGFREVKVLGSTKALAGVSAPDPKTVRIELARPFADLATFMAHPALGPVRGATVVAGFADAPVGNGPFMIGKARTPGGVTLRRYDGYGGQKPYLDQVAVEVRTDLSSVWTDLGRNTLDVGEIPAARIPEARNVYGSSGYTPFWAATYYGLNLKLPKYARVEVRRALSLAIDREEIIGGVYGGTKHLATGIIPTGIPGSRAKPCDACTRDLARARALMNTVFKGKPPPFRIDHLDASPSADVARQVAKDLQDAGLTVTLRAYGSQEYLNLLKRGGHDIAELGWLSDVPSADPFLAQQLRSGSVNNQTGFKDPTFDAAIDKARATAGEQARATAYAAAEARALELMPLIPLVFFRNHIAARRAVHGFRVNGAGVFDASAIWVDRAA